MTVDKTSLPPLGTLCSFVMAKKATAVARVSAAEIPAEAKLKKATAEAQLKEQLSADGKYIRPVKGNGNCVFGSIAVHVFGGSEHDDVVRQTVCNVLSAKGSERKFKPFLAGTPEFDSVNGNYNAYVARMRKAGVYGGHVEIIAASIAFNKGFMVHSPGRPVVKVMADESAPPAEFFDLAHYGEDAYAHFDAVLAKRSPAVAAVSRSKAPAVATKSPAPVDAPLDDNAADQSTRRTTRLDCRATHPLWLCVFVALCALGSWNESSPPSGLATSTTPASLALGATSANSTVGAAPAAAESSAMLPLLVFGTVFLATPAASSLRDDVNHVACVARATLVALAARTRHFYRWCKGRIFESSRTALTRLRWWARSPALVALAAIILVPLASTSLASLPDDLSALLALIVPWLAWRWSSWYPGLRLRVVGFVGPTPQSRSPSPPPKPVSPAAPPATRTASDARRTAQEVALREFTARLGNKKPVEKGASRGKDAAAIQTQPRRAPAPDSAAKEKPVTATAPASTNSGTNAVSADGQAHVIGSGHQFQANPTINVGGGESAMLSSVLDLVKSLVAQPSRAAPTPGKQQRGGRGQGGKGQEGARHQAPQAPFGGKFTLKQRGGRDVQVDLTRSREADDLDSDFDSIHEVTSETNSPGPSTSAPPAAPRTRKPRDSAPRAKPATPPKDAPLMGRGQTTGAAPAANTANVDGSGERDDPPPAKAATKGRKPIRIPYVPPRARAVLRLASAAAKSPGRTATAASPPATPAPDANVPPRTANCGMTLRSRAPAASAPAPRR